jgi:hypothetical protein
VNRRPISVTIVSLLFIVVGAGGFVKGVWSLVSGSGGITGHAVLDAALVIATALVAVVSGLFMLRGANWARWLCLAWMAFHVVISIGHDKFKLVVHVVWMVVLTIILFWRNASAYFKGGAPVTTTTR